LALTLEMAGAAAIGLVSGWWCAPLRSWVTLAAALAALALEAQWLGGSRSAVALLTGFAIGLATHTVFRVWLTSHVGHNKG
jgi:hypothetical protein